MEKSGACHVGHPCVGFHDYIKKHLAAYALECQTSLKLLSSDAAYNCSKNMLAAVGALVEMQGIVRMMGQICTGVVFEQRGSCGVMKELEGGPWGHKNLATTWWTTLRTLLAHRCWRYFPKLAVKLPEILLGGSFNGVNLQNEIFQEPGRSPEVQKQSPANGNVVLCGVLQDSNMSCMLWAGLCTGLWLKGAIS